MTIHCFITVHEKQTPARPNMVWKARVLLQK